MAKNCALLTACLALLLAACRDTTDQEVISRQHDRFVRQAKGLLPEEEADAQTRVIKWVKQSPASHGEAVLAESRTIAEWIQQQVDVATGQVLFPRWEARQRGRHHYEVRFTYTVLKPDYTIDRRGYSWPVDYSLQVVGQRVELDAQALDQESGHRPIMRRVRRSDERRVDLE